MRILVITSLPDPHVEMVAEHFQKGIRFVVFDPGSFPYDEELSFLWDDNTPLVIIRGGQLTDVMSVWYRKPLLIKPEALPVSNEYRELAFSSYKEMITWFYSALPDKLWVSDYWNIMRSNSKIYQIQVAHRLGFLLPATLITSSSNQALAFVKSRQNVVVKPLNIEFVRKDGKLQAAYAARLSYSAGLDFSGLKVSPVIFQEELQGLDVRVTVVADQVFPCIIEKIGGMKDTLDWRKGFYVGNIVFRRDGEFPEDLVQKCIQMVGEMGLKFGAFDFIKDINGDYWFLEINPNGQWGFVEEATGMPISRAIARLLTGEV